MICFPKTKLSVLVLAWVFCLATSISLEEKVLQLTDNYVELKDSFESRVTQLEIKVIQLENKVSKLESVIVALQADNHNSTTATVTAEKSVYFRTCQEIHDYDKSQSSGVYVIDPDGQNFNEESSEPIEVYCNMTTSPAVTTAVMHDSESNIEAENCQQAGCYKRDIHYSASDRQMAALAELSKECHQYFKYGCIEAPFEYEGIQVSWWDDRNGNQQYFWAGRYTSTHTCQCGISGTCIDVDKKCNCDSGISDLRADECIISDKNTLPVRRLNFGRTDTGSGQHTLGRFECSGKMAVDGKPKSCTDLRTLGHTLNGFYLVMNSKSVQNIYCDFTKLLNEQGFETSIGKVDVQSSPTFFYVQRNSIFENTETPITFEVETLNTGGAMNLASGKFTAPVTGTYFFSLSGVGYLDSSSYGNMRISLMRNGGRIGRAEVRLSKGSSAGTYTLQSTLFLQAGETIWVQVDERNEIYLYDDETHFTHFTGWLLQQNIMQSLNTVQ